MVSNLILVPVIICHNLSVAFCTVPVFINVLVEIFGHSAVMHVHSTAFESSMPKHHCTI